MKQGPYSEMTLLDLSSIFVDSSLQCQNVIDEKSTSSLIDMDTILNL